MTDLMFTDPVTGEQIGRASRFERARIEEGGQWRYLRPHFTWYYRSAPDKPWQEVETGTLTLTLEGGQHRLASVELRSPAAA